MQLNAGFKQQLIHQEKRMIIVLRTLKRLVI